jgi:hypothetical protein
MNPGYPATLNCASMDGNKFAQGNTTLNNEMSFFSLKTKVLGLAPHNGRRVDIDVVP